MQKLKDSRKLLHQFTYEIYTLSLGSFPPNSLSILLKREDLVLTECQCVSWTLPRMRKWRTGFILQKESCKISKIKF